MTPHRRTWHRSLAVTTVAASLLLAPLALGASSAQAEPVTPSVQPVQPLTTARLQGKPVSKKLLGKLADRPKGAQAVFVQIAGQGAADTSAASLRAGRSARSARSASVARRASVRRTSSAVVARATSSDAGTKVLFSVSNAVPGVAVRATTEALEAIAQRSDVVKISPLVPKQINNAGVAALTRALNSWSSPGVTGRGVKIGVIDTGIDYTHADFGGTGTVAAWQAARARSDAAFTPTAKVVGGHDFVGDSYNADPSAADYQPVPEPDQNPLDCEGHGTHVSGTAAGYGVTAAGSTFTGDYAKLTAQQLLQMRIGPGMAPQASLFGLKVFGCTGSTDEVIPALDWALDPNGDGNFADHLDIVNLSLGSDYAVADDPENAVVDKIAAHGVLPVIAAGNAGDLTDAAGEPGNAVRSLTVASSVDAYQLRDGLTVDAPANLAGIAPGQFSIAYPWATKPDITGPVVALSAANADGCLPLSAADQATVQGKVAWLEWDDNDATRACGSKVRSANVADAGAIGAVFTSAQDVFGAGILGSQDIPVIQLPRAETDRLRPAVVAGSLKVTFSGSLQGTIKTVTPAIADTLSSFSSRGTHGAPGVVKPDITAPGDTVTSAGMGTGNDQLTISGTSMATPVTAGIAALVKKTHPRWSTEQLKAALMNTAGHDLYTDTNRSGHRYGPARVGAGRVDALAAVRTKVLAYGTAHKGSVSVSFGSVEVPITKSVVEKAQDIRIQSTSNKRVTLKLAYSGIITQPGVSYRVSPAQVSLKPQGSTKVRVIMTARTSELRHTIDPTMATTQTDAYLGVDRARQYVSDASGRVLVKQTGHAALRVPVYGAAKPVSRTSAVDSTYQKEPVILVTGKGVSQGSGSTAFDSKLSVMDFGYQSAQLPTCTGPSTTGCASPQTRSADLKYVGAGATPSPTGNKADGWLWFGMSTFANWATIGNTTLPFVDFDTTGDGVNDYQVYAANEPSTDLLTSYLVDLHATDPKKSLVDVEPINFLGGDFDTNVFDTNTLLIPVWPAAIGMTATAKSFPITYSAGTLNYLAADPSGVVDQTPPVRFDVAAPKVRVAGPLYLDQAGAAIPYQLGAAAPSLPARTTKTSAAVTSAAGAKALVIHLQGSTASGRAQVLRLQG